MFGFGGGGGVWVVNNTKIGEHWELARPDFPQLNQEMQRFRPYVVLEGDSCVPEQLTKMVLKKKTSTHTRTHTKP